MFDHIEDPVEIANMCINSDKGRWWGNPEFGSKLWLLEKEKITNETPRKVREAIDDAIAWMVPDKLLKSFEIIVETARNRVNWQVILILPDSTPENISGGYNGV